MTKYILYIICGIMCMAAVCVEPGDLSNDTVDRDQTKKSKSAEDMHTRKGIETDRGPDNDVTEPKRNIREGSFNTRPRREVHDLPSEDQDRNTISSNSGYSECYLCPAGPPGHLGPRGTPGRNGLAGFPGIIGYPGEPGLPGTTGDPGQPGRDGRDGTLGSCGGNEDITDATNTTTGSGVVFVRWGKTSCPSTSLLVYSGVSAGTHFNNQGGSADILCLPSTPQYSRTESGRQDMRSPVSTVEYHSTVFGGRGQDLPSHKMPCSVCMAPRRRTQLMIPARNTCPTSEWTLEYSGYLQSSRKRWYRTVAICLDESPEAMPGNGNDVNRVLLVNTEYRCSQCGDYTDGFELSCAVCTI